MGWRLWWLHQTPGTGTCAGCQLTWMSSAGGGWPSRSCTGQLWMTMCWQCQQHPPKDTSAPGGPAGTVTATGSPATAAAGPYSLAKATVADQTAVRAPAPAPHLDPADRPAPVVLRLFPGPHAPALPLNRPPALNPQVHHLPPEPLLDPRGHHLGRRHLHQAPAPAIQRAETAPPQVQNPAARALHLAVRAQAPKSPRGHRRGLQDRQILGAPLIPRTLRSLICRATSQSRLHRAGSTPAWSRCRRCSVHALFSMQ